MKKLLYLILACSSFSICNAQIGRFLGGGGVFLLNDYVKQQQTTDLDINYAGALSVYIVLGANVFYLNDEQSISLTVDPLYSLGNIRSDFVSQHFALPIMAKYNWGFLSNMANERKIGLSFGAGLSKHWLLGSQDLTSKWQPTIAFAFRAQVPQCNLNLFRMRDNGMFEKTYNDWEIVLYHGFEQELLQIENPNPNTFTWTALCLRVYFNHSSYARPFKIGF